MHSIQLAEPAVGVDMGVGFFELGVGLFAVSL